MICNGNPSHILPIVAKTLAFVLLYRFLLSNMRVLRFPRSSAPPNSLLLSTTSSWNNLEFSHHRSHSAEPVATWTRVREMFGRDNHRVLRASYAWHALRKTAEKWSEFEPTGSQTASPQMSYCTICAEQFGHHHQRFLCCIKTSIGLLSARSANLFANYII